MAPSSTIAVSLIPIDFGGKGVYASYTLYARRWPATLVLTVPRSYLGIPPGNSPNARTAEKLPKFGRQMASKARNSGIFAAMRPMTAFDPNPPVELGTDDRRFPEVKRTVPKGFRVAGPRPERPLKFRPGKDCNGLVTGRRLGYMNECRLSAFHGRQRQRERIWSQH